MTFWIIFLYFLPLIIQLESQSDRVLLRDVTSLTLRRGEYTTGRRSSSIPQLQCVGGTAYGQYSPKTVQCYNRGFDGVDVQWECKSQMSSEYEFGKIDVSCEGYSYPEDPYILAGSCGLKYELDYTVSGAKRASYQGTSTKYVIGYLGFRNGLGISFEELIFRIDTVKIVYFVIACFVIYLIYTTLTSSREGDEGDRRSGGSGFNPGPGHPPGNDYPHPPGWRQPPPSYEDSCKFGNQGRPSRGSSSGGPGFFTGLGLGALGGYLFGNNGYSDGTYRRRNRGYTQFERDTGFHDMPSTSSSYYENEPSTSSHTSSQFGGTSRR